MTSDKRKWIDHELGVLTEILYKLSSASRVIEVKEMRRTIVNLNGDEISTLYAMAKQRKRELVEELENGREKI